MASFKVKMWHIFAFFLKNSFGQFAAFHFSSSDEIRH
jgi:hypothetical protein